MNKFAQNIIKYRISIIIVTILLTIFFSIGLTQIRINSDILTYLKPNDPVVKLFNRVGDEYNGNFLVMVGIETDDVFSLRSLELIRDLSEAYKGIEGVKSVTSLTDVLDIRKSEGMLEVGRLIDKDNIPQSPEELQNLKKYALSKELYRGRIVSEDGKKTLIVCRITHEVNRAEVARQIKSITKSKSSDVKVYYSGIPVQISDLQNAILKDVIRLVPLVSVVIIFILIISFRSLRGVLLPLIGVLISTIWALGLMGWLKVSLSLISNIMPVVLIAIGSAYGIHFVSKYEEDKLSDGNGKEITAKVLSEVGLPIALAGVTTLIGFLSFFGSYLTAITEFGVYTAIGVGFALIISITFLPAVTSFLKAKKPITSKDRSGKSVIMPKISNAVINHKLIILLIIIGISIVSILGLPLIHRSVDLLEYFPKRSDTRLSEEFMRKYFGGSLPIQIIIKGDIRDPYTLKKIHKLEKFINSLPYISNTQSIAGLISEMNDVMNGRFCVPDTREGVSNLWFFIESESIVEQMVNRDSTEALIQAQIATENTREVLKNVRAIDQYIKQLNESLTVVFISEPNINKKYYDILFEDIAESIYYDAISRNSNLEINKDFIKGVIIKASKMKSNLVIADSFKEELYQFFRNESQLVLPSDEKIKAIIDSTIDLVKRDQIKRDILVSLLRSAMGSDQIDERSLEMTTDALLEKSKEAYGNAKVDYIMSQIMPIFPSELTKNKDFINSVKGDLWLINEQKLIIQTTDKGEKIQFSAIQSGMPTVYELIDKSLLKNQLQSLILAISLVLIILSIQFRSIKIGFISTTPIIFTVLVNFGIMAYLHIPLDIATLMVAGISIGIGIDYAIHFTNRFRLELGRNSDETKAIMKTIETTGRAIIVNASSVAFGFSILLLAQLNPIKQFGWMVAVTMIVSSLSAITYLPSIIIVSKLKYRYLNGGD
ncbi:MAG: efflux RND transporter permease subunit [Candidatus Poribacteria bacterium]